MIVAVCPMQPIIFFVNDLNSNCTTPDPNPQRNDESATWSVAYDLHTLWAITMCLKWSVVKQWIMFTAVVPVHSLAIPTAQKLGYRFCNYSFIIQDGNSSCSCCIFDTKCGEASDSTNWLTKSIQLVYAFTRVSTVGSLSSTLKLDTLRNIRPLHVPWASSDDHRAKYFLGIRTQVSCARVDGEAPLSSNDLPYVLHLYRLICRNVILPIVLGVYMFGGDLLSPRQREITEMRTELGNPTPACSMWMYSPGVDLCLHMDSLCLWSTEVSRWSYHTNDNV